MFIQQCPAGVENSECRGAGLPQQFPASRTARIEWVAAGWLNNGRESNPIRQYTNEIVEYCPGYIKETAASGLPYKSQTHIRE